MPVGALNAAPTFVEMMMKLYMELDKLSKERVLKNIASKIIVGGVLLYGRTSEQILDYFRTVLDILKHHRATLKLKKLKWFQDRCEFVGVDVVAVGKKPEQSKNEAFTKLEQPNTWGDFRMLIGLFGFYRQLFPLYELDIKPWRYIFSNLPQPGTLSQKE